jgi:hypothetical protein
MNSCHQNTIKTTTAMRILLAVNKQRYIAIYRSKTTSVRYSKAVILPWWCAFLPTSWCHTRAEKMARKVTARDFIFHGLAKTLYDYLPRKTAEKTTTEQTLNWRRDRIP